MSGDAETLARYVRKGTSYLLEDMPWELRYEFVELALSEGANVLVITRIHPRRLDRQFSIKDADLIWLTSTPPHDGARVRTISPESSVKVHMTLQSFFRDRPDGVAILDGLEYLISQNGFTMTMKLVQMLNETIAVSDAILIVPVNTSALDDAWRGILQRELHPVNGEGLAAFARGLESIN